jgi:hypothetical protein
MVFYNTWRSCFLWFSSSGDCVGTLDCVAQEAKLGHDNYNFASFDSHHIQLATHILTLHLFGLLGLDDKRNTFVINRHGRATCDPYSC